MKASFNVNSAVGTAVRQLSSYKKTQEAQEERHKWGDKRELSRASRSVLSEKVANKTPSI